MCGSSATIYRATLLSVVRPQISEINGDSEATSVQQIPSEPNMHRITKLAFIFAAILWLTIPATAQDAKPLTNQEFVKLLYELPRSPEMRDDLIEQIRRRGIGFPLTDGMRSLVATKSGSDALLRRTL